MAAARPNPLRRVGRPLDLTAEDRILSAGMAVYGREGWRGATMSAIAREAGVGKALLYSRFASSEAILLTAFETFIPELTGEFSNIRDLLLAEANRMAALYLSDYSLAVRRALIDAGAGVEPFPQIAENMNRRTVLPMRRHVRAAIESGELPPWTRVTPLLDVIEGSVRMHVLAAPHLTDKIRAGLDEYIRQLVDEQLLLLTLLGPHRGYPNTSWEPPWLATSPGLGTGGSYGAALRVPMITSPGPE